MKKIAATVATAVLSGSLLAAAPASADVEPPKAWGCTTTDHVTYHCKTRFKVKAGPSQLNWLWASKTCKATATERMTALGFVPIEVYSGADQVRGRIWLCGAFWSMVRPAPSPSPSP